MSGVNENYDGEIVLRELVGRVGGERQKKRTLCILREVRKFSLSLVKWLDLPLQRGCFGLTGKLNCCMQSAAEILYENSLLLFF